MKKFNWEKATRYEMNAVFKTPELPQQLAKTGPYDPMHPRICMCCSSLVRGTCFDDITTSRDHVKEAVELFREARRRKRFPVTDAVAILDETPHVTGPKPNDAAARAALFRLGKDDSAGWIKSLADSKDGPITLTLSTETQLFPINMPVMARWKGGSYFSGVVVGVPAEGYYAVDFDDGDKDPHCPAAHVKPKGSNNE